MPTTCLLGVVWVIFVTGYQGQIKETQPGNVEETGQQGPKESVPLVAQPAPAEQKHSSREKAKDYLKRAFGPEFLASWVLVFAAGIGLFATFRTLRIIKRQTTATEDAANAAKLNAQTLVNSERAWVEGEILVKPLNMEETAHILRVTNHGRTPAHLVSYEIRCGRFIENEPFFADRLGLYDTVPLQMFLGSDKTADLEFLRFDDIFHKIGSAVVGHLWVMVKYTDVIAGGPQREGNRETSFLYRHNRLTTELIRVAKESKYT